MVEYGRIAYVHAIVTQINDEDITITAHEFNIEESPVNSEAYFGEKNIFYVVDHLGFRGWQVMPVSIEPNLKKFWCAFPCRDTEDKRLAGEEIESLIEKNGEQE